MKTDYNKSHSSTSAITQEFLMKNSFKKALVAVLIIACGVWALDNVPYIDENGVMRTANDVTVINSDGGERTTLNSGWYLMQGTFTNNGIIIINGTVYLILENGSDVTVNGRYPSAINVSNGSNLSIYAQSTDSNMGKLIANSSNGAGIGDWKYGYEYDDKAGGNTITIAGGTVIATSENNGSAAIGYSNSNRNTIIITGGTVTAAADKSFSGSVGIGFLHDDNNSDNKNNNTITITGGTINATGDKGGIFGGTIIITDGTITAVGTADHYSTGIGNTAGDSNSCRSSFGTITISGGTVTATGTTGIGSRTNGCGGSFGGTITITGGTVVAIGSNSEIGSTGIGSSGTGNFSGTITISGGTVTTTATGGNRGSSNNGVGIGSNGNGFSLFGGTITIIGGTTTAVGFGGTGIGSINSNASTGTFILGGNAVVFANGVSDSDESRRTSGILFIDTNGKVYGNVELQENLVIENDYTLDVLKGATLTIPNGITLTNNGTVTPENGSTVIVQGIVAENKIIGANAFPTIISKTATSITLGGTADLLAATGQVVEYAINTTNTTPASGWQTETIFEGLTENKTYWIFARSKENSHFAAGTISAGLQVSTKATPTIANLNFNIPTDHIYTGTAQGIGDVTAKTAGLGTITVYYNGNPDQPIDIGTYVVTVDIAESTNFDAVSGIVLGEYIIIEPEETPTFPNRENPKIGRIGVQTTTNTILLSNLPKGTKVEVFNLQGKRIYSAHPENPKILRIGVQTGIYIIKTGTQTMRVAVR